MDTLHTRKLYLTGQFTATQDDVHQLFNYVLADLRVELVQTGRIHKQGVGWDITRNNVDTLLENWVSKGSLTYKLEIIRSSLKSILLTWVNEKIYQGDVDDNPLRVLDEVIDEVMAVRKAGQAEYAHNLGNALENFDRNGRRLLADMEADVAARLIIGVYFGKHYDGVIAYYNGHRSQREPVYGRFKDMSCYLLLMWAMVLREIYRV